ncbi:unnamed protein product [Fraxinus pennsylvanica]|uniref:non-specific serine/threonine protein kinase n=1 Tax=Fraxinus pennsylvanica TaxID=56036 RepID=A0AAD2AG12_9LAMI|nr:unnamed protein product [Fraxinus pennsylvanica]
MLELSANRISGNLPSSLGNVLPDLFLVYLNNNHLTGEIPMSISNISQIEILNLDFNFFTGRVPKTVGNPQKLDTLDISYNQLTNDPSTLELDFLISLKNCSKLQNLNIRNNHFDGRLPKSLALGNWSESLWHLDAGSCGIKGPIPNEIGNLSNLIQLEMGGNELNGRIPDALGKLKKLQKLKINSCNLTRSIPVTLCELGRLFELNLENNQLSRPLPGCLGNISSLRKIYLGHNELTSVELSVLWTNKDLQIVDLSYNNLNGSLGSEIGSVKGIQLLNLSGNQFSSDIPNTIGQLENLENLIFSSNKLHGSIPESFSELIALQYLDLSHNNLFGVIPKSFGTLKNLVYLNVSFNELSGEIPNEGIFKNLTASSFTGNRDLWGASQFEVMQCKANTARSSTKTRVLKYVLPSVALVIILAIIMIWLMTRCNRKTGRIPFEIGNLSMLQALILDSNHLTENRISGNLPSSVGNVLPNLFLVYLSDNQLRGEIPMSISNLSRLKILDLDINSFTGQVPTTLGNLQNLDTLGIVDNQLTNDPSMLELDFLISLKNCSKLKTIRIRNNNFDGRLPKSLALGNWTESLWHLDAGSCGIKGPIPNEIGNLSNLIQLDMGGNDLNGGIPDALGKLKKLQKLKINSCNLTGSIPVTFCELGRLFELNLENNQLSHPLPGCLGNTLCELGRLFELNLENSQLSRPLPGCLGNISSLRKIYLGHNELTSVELSVLWTNKDLQIVDLSYNNLNGSLGSEIGSVKGIQLLNLSGNQFSSDIPNTIGQLENLENLIFSSNKLHGSIPESFSELIALQYLDLSHNNLFGVIPKSFETLKNLVYLNVSFNELSGEIPNEGIFKNLTASSFTGNRDLWGASQFEVMQCKANTARSSTKTRVLKYVLPSVALVIILAIIMIWLMTRCNRKTGLTTQSSSLITVKRISYYDILKSTNNFDDENLIGRGSIGSVYKGTFSDGMIAAIKVFNLNLETANQSFDTECNILCNIRHRNLVTGLGSCSNLDFKALVLDYMPKGNFSSWLYSFGYCLNIDQRLEIMIDLGSALAYLHHGHPSPVVHCDLKPSNILLDEDMVVHVGDFGISKLLTEDQRILHTQTLGTIGYMAPEYGSTGLISTMADVYSYGIILMETFTKKKPTDDIFAGDLSMRGWLFELYPDKVIQAMDVDLVDGVEENIVAKESCFRSIMGLALECTSDLPEERLNMENVLIRLKKIKMEFLSNVTEEE